MIRIDTSDAPIPHIKSSGIEDINKALPIIMDFDPSVMVLVDYRDSPFTYEEGKTVPAIFLDVFLENKELVPEEWKRNPAGIHGPARIVFTGTVFSKDMRKYFNTLEISESGEITKDFVICGFDSYGKEVRFK